MSTVEELGNQAYKKALFQDFKGALSILDKAIAKFPRDPRLYNNRSYCYWKLNNFRSALKDAEFMVDNFPTYSRSYYRKAEALVGLKKFHEAEPVIREFLKLEPKNAEARFLLSEVQIAILCGTGKHWVQDAVRALRLTGNDTEIAAEFLKVGGRKGSKSYSPGDIYQSDEDEPSWQSQCSGTSTRSNMQPQNPTSARLNTKYQFPQVSTRPNTQNQSPPTSWRISSSN